MIYLQDPDVTLYLGDVVDVLRELPDESVHMACTARRRSTGCATTGPGRGKAGTRAATTKPSGRRASTPARRLATKASARRALQLSAYRDTCGKCGARRVDQQIGLEATPDLWVARLVEVFREVRRVLRTTAVVARWVTQRLGRHAVEARRGDAAALRPARSATSATDSGCRDRRRRGLIAIHNRPAGTPDYASYGADGSVTSARDRSYQPKLDDRQATGRS